MKRVKFESEASFEANASLDDGNLGWLDFILTDDQPNGNDVGIPTEKLSYLVDTGIHMPIKMAEDEIQRGHEGAKPLGPIVELQRESNQVNGRAAIWANERPNDYRMLKEMSSNGEPINISWELAYTESEMDDDGVEWLQDPVLRAATIVGNPAYAGRTPVVRVASKNIDEDTEKEINKILSEKSDAISALRRLLEKEELNQDAINEIISMLEDTNENMLSLLGVDEAESSDGDDDMEKLEELRNKLNTLRDQFDTISDEKDELQEEYEELTDELAELREYKQDREEADRRAEVLSERLEKLKDAGYEPTDEELQEKATRWATMSEDAFAEMLSMLEKVRSKEASASSDNDVPDLSGPQDFSTQEALLKGLREELD
jgi:hypothetical protein